MSLHTHYSVGYNSGRWYNICMSNDESEHKYHFSNALISKEKWARAFGKKSATKTDEKKEKATSEN